MDPKKFLSDTAERIYSLLPEGATQLSQDVKKSVRHILQDTFTQLDLVTREEFDTQTKVLARTRQKIEILETKLAAFEAAQTKSSHK